MLFDLTDGRMNGFELTVLTSHENADKILREFRNWYFYGKHNDDIEEVLDDICTKLNIHDGDLLPEDIDRVRNEIMEFLGDC
jgi:hypothetical protein